MKKTQEFTGKNVDTAVKTACSTLGISKNDLKYEVVSAGTSGIFGIVGRKHAKIKVSLPKSGKNKTSAEEMKGIHSIVDEAFGTEPPRKKQAQEKAAPPQAEAPEAQEKAAPSQAEAPEEADQEDAGRWDSTPAARDTTGERQGDPEIAEGKESEAEAEPEPEGPPPVPVSQASIDLGVEALKKMADLITDDAQIEAITEEDRLTLQITGGNAGILIGRKGQTLDAMQFLVDKIINRQSEARVRVKVDIEGYMETRKTNLRQLAFKMAEKAKKTGRPATINQMSAQDRRIVHLALKDDSQVRTQSMGDGYYRRLVIFPKKRSASRGKRRSKRNDT
jgi:spoIIIJ-associated protein